MLRGKPSAFALELPPYRAPQVGQVLVRSVFDRTLFVLGFPANEIVLPIAVMGYLAQGSLSDALGLAQMHTLLTANGWTWTTAVSAVLFFLLHWPCSTTLWTIRRETGSAKWTLLAALLPTALGMALCAAFTALARLIGW